MERRLEKVCDEADSAKCQWQNLGGAIWVSLCRQGTGTTERKLPSPQQELVGSLRRRRVTSAERGVKCFPGHSARRCMLRDHIRGGNLRKSLPCPGDSSQSQCSFLNIKPRSFLGLPCPLLDITSKIKNRSEFLKSSTCNSRICLSSS